MRLTWEFSPVRQCPESAGTIVTQRSSVSWINPTGSPALATAGSGDALSGMIGAMFAQHFELMDCVLSAVYLHGAAVEGLNSGVLAGDIAPLASTCLEELRASYQGHFHPLKEEEKNDRVGRQLTKPPFSLCSMLSAVIPALNYFLDDEL